MTIQYRKIAFVLVPAVMLLGLAAPVLAADISASGTATVGTAATTTKVAAKLQAADVKLRDKSATEIAKRIDDLNTLAARITAMNHVSASTKTNLNASMQSDITALTNLKNKIDADTVLADLKADVASITKAYRIYALVVPQTRILAAADRSATVSDMMTAIDAKFQTRIATASAAGRDVTAITAAETDMKAKIADTQVQSTAAISGISNLTPDNGDAAIMTSNTTALTRARADIRVAMSDLSAANKDIKTIVAALKGFNLDASASATTTQ